MFSHVTLGTSDIARSRAFFDPIMKLLGHPVLMTTEQALGYGLPAGEKTFYPDAVRRQGG